MYQQEVPNDSDITFSSAASIDAAFSISPWTCAQGKLSLTSSRMRETWEKSELRSSFSAPFREAFRPLTPWHGGHILHKDSTCKPAFYHSMSLFGLLNGNVPYNIPPKGVGRNPKCTDPVKESYREDTCDFTRLYNVTPQRAGTCHGA